MFCEISIIPNASGFNGYHTEECGIEYEYYEDLIWDMRNACHLHGYALYQLGIDMLPEDVPDIRGSIENEPSIIFAVVYPDYNLKPTYHGIIEY